MQDLQHSDCIVIEGSSFAEAHPVGFQWVMEAKARGAVLIHVDPRFTRTSALADIHVPIRAGTDIVFLGAVIRHVLETDSWFHEYVLNYTNAATLVTDDYEDAEDRDGVFGGLHEKANAYDNDSWQYIGMSVQQTEQHQAEDYERRLQAVKDAGTARRTAPAVPGCGGSRRPIPRCRILAACST